MNNTLTWQDYQDRLLEAMETMIKKEISQAKFDQTVIGKIVAQDSENLNKYQVESNNLKFYAYSDKTTYAKGNSVQILIPQGDYGLEKTIIGGAISFGEELTQEKISANRFSNLITAKKIEIIDMVAADINFKYDPGYKYMGFKAWLSTPSDKVVANPFAITAQFYNSNQEIIYETTVFKNEDILGNSRKINKNIPHYKLFEYPEDLECKNISSIQLTVYGDETDSEVCPTIEKAEFHFGYDVRAAADNNLILYTNNLQYSTAEDREIYVEWFRDGEIYNIYNLPPENDNISLYSVKYTRGYTPEENKDAIVVRINSYAGVYQEPLEEIKHKMSFTVNNNVDAHNSKYKVVLEEKNITETIGEDSETVENINYSYSSSSVLVFENTNITSGASNSGEPIILQLEDGDTGVYNCYDLNGNLMSGYGSQTKSIVAYFADDLSQPIDVTEERIEKIEWIYPVDNTGLSILYHKQTEDDNGEVIWETTMLAKDAFTIDGNPITISQDKTTGKFSETFYYTLNSYCYSGYQNNKITCKVYLKDGSVQEGSFIFQFGGYGNNGTNYNLNIDFATPGKWYLRPGEEAQLVATFTNKDGSAVDIIPDFQWSVYELPQYTPYTEGSMMNSLEFFFINEHQEYTFLTYYDWIEKIVDDNNRSYYSLSSNGAYYLDSSLNKIQYTENSIYIKAPSITQQTFPYYYAIVQVTAGYTLENGFNALITDYLAIPYCFDSNEANEYVLKGDVSVVYNMEGQISMNKTPYILEKNGIAFNNNTEVKWILSAQQQKSEPIKKYNSNGELSAVEYEQMQLITHKLKTTIDYINHEIKSINLDSMSSVLVNEKPLVASVVVADINTGKYLFIQPILTRHNAWNKQGINEWVGTNVESTEEYILAPMIAAGAKDTSNRFTGVMLGQNSGSDLGWGVYGYQSGSPRFYFTENGTAYIGKPSDDPINDPNGGHYIRLNSSGELELKLQEYYLDTPGVKLYSSNKDEVAQGLSIYDEGYLRINIGALGEINETGTGFEDISSLNFGIQIFDNDNKQVFYFDTDENTLVIDTEKGTVAGWDITPTAITRVVTIDDQLIRTSINSTNGDDSSVPAFGLTTNDWTDGVLMKINWDGSFYTSTSVISDTFFQANGELRFGNRYSGTYAGKSSSKIVSIAVNGERYGTVWGGPTPWKGTDEATMEWTAELSSSGEITFTNGSPSSCISIVHSYGSDGYNGIIINAPSIELIGNVYANGTKIYSL